MRAIKFRAWDTQAEEILYGVEHTYDGYKVSMPSFGALLDCPDFYIVMQYTGLKDKNGKEIYEGDILELRANPFNRKRDLFQVVFKDGGFRDEWNNYIGQYLPPDIRNKQGGRVRLNEACEVVGNIYENKELLNE